jgi:molybdopterin molybdotransferase
VAHYPAGFAWERPDTRREEFLRVKLVRQDGQWQLQRYPNQGSGVLTPAPGRTGWCGWRPGQQVQPGDMLALLPISG